MTQRTKTTGIKMGGGIRRTFTHCVARKSALMNIAKEARQRMAVISVMKWGCSMEIMGPGVTLWIIRAPRSMAAGGLPGIPRVNKGMIAPTIQALLPVSHEMTPAYSPFPKFSGCFDAFLAPP